MTPCFLRLEAQPVSALTASCCLVALGGVASVRVGGKWPHAIPRNDPTSGVSSLAVLWRRDAVTERLVHGGSQGRRELLKPPPGRAPLCLLPHGPVYAGGGSGALFPLLKLLAENEPLWSVGKARWYILERATLFQGPRKLEAGDSSTHHLSGRLHVARRGVVTTPGTPVL